MNTNKIPCSCGHLEKEHVDIKAPLWDIICKGKTDKHLIKKYIIFWCQCNKYQADNLKYLEQCYKKKKRKAKHV